MISTSTPFPITSPSSLKRDGSHVDHPRPKARGPFLESEGDDSDEEELSRDEPAPKRPMLRRSSEGFQTSKTLSELRNNKNGDLSSSASAGLHEETDVFPTKLGNSLSHYAGSLWASKCSRNYTLKTSRGETFSIKERTSRSTISYESIVAARSKTKEGRAKRSYYGIEIHSLISAASVEESTERKPVEPKQHPSTVSSIEHPKGEFKKAKKCSLWTEKYRARNFMDLCGDDATNRTVLRWLKKWDHIVFPGAIHSRHATVKRQGAKSDQEEKPHRKILLLTGAPGLGKTTLAHVCAKQAGYEVMEINASDDRSRDVVKTRIRTSLGTESVKSVSNSKGGDLAVKVAKPVCVVVDEVDGVVTGSGGAGEGGFIKALIDLVTTDQQNSDVGTSETYSRKKRKGDDFRQMRPLILICNDVYHPSLRPLRQSNLAEIVHAGQPTMDAVVGRLKYVLDKEGIPCDKDAARKLCEAAWGVTSGIDARRGAESAVEGDLRGVMVVGEWVAGRFRSASQNSPGQRLTRQWLEKNLSQDLASGAAGSRGLGRGNVRDIVSRVFQEGGGFPKQALNLSKSKNEDEQPKPELGFGEYQKKHAMERLRQMIETSGEISRVMTDIMAEYPDREYNDDSYLTKPNIAYDWLHFHDSCQSRLFASQEWELAPYLSQSVLACHDLFASPKRHYAATSGYDKRWGANAGQEEGAPMPFTGPRADYQANEAEKQTRAQLQAMQSQLTPSLMRSFRSAEDIATDFLPYLSRLISPDVKPVVVGGSQGTIASVRKESERRMVKRAAEALAELKITLVKGKIESNIMASHGPQYVYRMEPDIDGLSTFETGAAILSSQAPTRYAVRQVLDQELQRTIVARENLARQARYQAGGSDSMTAPPLPIAAAATITLHDDKENYDKGRPELLIKRDFFGRIVEARPLAELDSNIPARSKSQPEHKVWVTFHEGLNNAVRKPISVQEFLKTL